MITIMMTILVYFCREKIFITAPNVFRVGVNETVTVSVFNTDQDQDVEVTIYLEKRERTRGLAWPYSYTTVAVRRGESLKMMIYG